MLYYYFNDMQNLFCILFLFLSGPDFRNSYIFHTCGVGFPKGNLKVFSNRNFLKIYLDSLKLNGTGFKWLIQFMYTDELTPVTEITDFDLLFELYRLADKVSKNLRHFVFVREEPVPCTSFLFC
jgi:hypothetical protein